MSTLHVTLFTWSQIANSFFPHRLAVLKYWDPGAYVCYTNYIQIGPISGQGPLHFYEQGFRLTGPPTLKPYLGPIIVLRQLLVIRNGVCIPNTILLG